MATREVKCKLTAILSADVKGYSRLMGMSPLISNKFFQNMPKTLSPLLHSGILLAAISAVILNAYFHGMGSGAEARRSAAASTHGSEA